MTMLKMAKDLISGDVIIDDKGQEATVAAAIYSRRLKKIIVAIEGDTKNVYPVMPDDKFKVLRP